VNTRHGSKDIPRFNSCIDWPGVNALMVASL
jgi:hypothetical protein